MMAHLEESGSGERDAADATRNVFDQEASLVRLGGSREIFDMLVGLYFDDAARLLRELHEAETAGDLSQLGRAAHTLKGLAANFDAADAVAAALRVESLAQAGNLAAARQHLPLIDREFERLRQALVARDAPRG